MSGLAQWMYRDVRILIVALLLIVSMGLSAALTVGRQEDPTITNLFASVLTPYPGAEPGRVEALITEPIEQELRQIAEIEEISSVSRSGLSSVQIDLVETLTDAEIDTAWTEIRAALEDAAAVFPPGVPEPSLDTDGPGAYTLIFALTSTEGHAASEGVLARLAEALADTLRGVGGTDLVETYGAGKEEITVSVDPARLAGLGIGIDEVAAALARADARAPAGEMVGAGREISVDVSGAFDDLARIRAVPVLTARDGAVLRLDALATVSRGVAQPAESLARLDGKPAVLIAARMEADLQVDGWAARARQVAATFAEGLPPSVGQALIFDQSTYTAARFDDLGRNMAAGVGLVSAVLFVTLGWRAALVVASALPLAGLMALFAMGQMGLSVHQMSVTGMIVALGLLVDAAIVVTDELKKRIDAGEPRLEAVGGTVKLLVVPLLASTATTVFAFLPMALLPGPVGDFVGSIAKAVIAMLVASFLLAITVTPALAALGLGRQARSRRRWWRDGIDGGLVGRLFDRSLRAALQSPWLAMWVAMALPIIGFLAFPTLTAQFFPGADRDQFHVQVTLAPGTSITRTDAAVDRADALLRALPEVKSVAWVSGESAPAFYYNMQSDQDGVSGFAEALVTTRNADGTRPAMQAAQIALDASLPDAQAIVRELTQGPPVAAPVEVRLVGPDNTVLRTLAERAQRAMAMTPGIVLARSSAAGGAPKIAFALDEDAVSRTGLDLATVASRLSSGLSGTAGGLLIEGVESVPVRVRWTDATRATPEALGALTMPVPGAAEGVPAVPLAALGRLTVEPAGTAIRRRHGERIALVQGFVATGVLPEEALAALRPALDDALDPLPPGYRLEFGGDSDERAGTVSGLLATVGLVVTLTVGTLIVSFGSVRLMLLTTVVAVLAAGLSLLSLAVTGYPFGVNALIGVIGSVGVSVNAAIIVLSAMHADPAVRAGDRVAARRVVAGAGRHIVSTTITTVGGFLPLIIGGGGFWPPFATAVAGGVLLSAIVSFFFTPPAYMVIMQPGRARRVAPMAAVPA